ncbi:hypothetical protein JI58_05250 [Marinosulfonomonas sp. PRT-SC04]|nr:hypothetical protein JI58_05250 [Marinosulfonomonas sp. PRT-SC04]
MALNTPLGDDSNSEEILLIAENHFGRMLRRAEEIITTLEDENSCASKEAAVRIRDLGKAMQTTLDERSKLEKLRKNNAGIVHDYALDFDAARDEIGRRMARLRDAASSGGIPE